MTPIIQIDDKLISVDIFEKYFACELESCAGACCVLGDSGAPLEKEECKLLEQEYPFFSPYMKKEGRKAVEEQGFSLIDADGDQVTPLIAGKECAYSYFDAQAICCCAIERAFLKEKTNFRKPISCWLYPIRLKPLGELIGLNYDQCHTCSCAREKGTKEKMPVYRFLKEPIIRRFGVAFYEQLEKTARTIRS